jgi:molecular chaperone GrpE (heat shock protein)
MNKAKNSTNVVPSQASEEIVPSVEETEGMPPTPLSDRLEAIETRLSDIEQLIAKRLRYDEAKEKAFDVLYEKMRQYEENFQASLKKELIRSLLLLYDNMVKAEEALVNIPEAQQRVSDLREELLNALYVQEVEPMGDLGEFYDKQKQQAIKVIPTDDPSEDGKVEQVTREGFLWAGKVLRPQEVVIRRD